MTEANSRKNVWEANIDSEIAFWRDFIMKRGGEWPEVYSQRMDPDAPFPGNLREVITANPAEPVEALDVGCGPLTLLGRNWPGRTVHVTAVDPLAEHYMQLFREAGVMPPTPPQRCDGEQLLERFGRDRFHVAVAINSLDHSYDPVSAIKQMVAVTKPGGFLWLRHRINEGENEQYHGLHQWNFQEQNGRFVIWNATMRIDMGEALGAQCSVKARTDGEWMDVEIRKRPA